MSEPQMWPEQEAVEDWWAEHRLELKEAVSRYRITRDAQLTEARRLMREVADIASQVGVRLVAIGRDGPYGQKLLGCADRLRAFADPAPEGKED